MIKFNKLFIALAFVACSTGTTTETGVVINGVKWATRNVDMPNTFAAKPESAGMFYQWNRKTAWNTTDEEVTGWDNTPTTGTTWESANNPCPKGWRVPTKEELSLLDTEKVTSEWTTENGISGRRFTDKTTNKSIFLPAAGFRHNGSDSSDNGDGALHYAGKDGSYWSSTETNTYVTYSLGFCSGYACWDSQAKTHGFSVRCVEE